MSNSFIEEKWLMKCELIKHTSERRGRKTGKMSGWRVLMQTRVSELEGTLWYLFKCLKSENIIVNLTSRLSHKLTISIYIYFSSPGKAAKGGHRFGTSVCLWGSDPQETFVQFSQKFSSYEWMIVNTLF